MTCFQGVDGGQWFRRTNVVQANGTNQVWVYDSAGQLLYLSQSGGTGGSQTVDYLYLGHRLVAQSGSAGTSYLHTDIQGSPEKTTNTGRTVVTSTSYEPYGNTAAGTAPTTVGYTGHVNDPELNLVYMQARYYDPIAARFLSVDPVVTDTSSGGAFGRYAYVGNDPMDKTDPTGTEIVVVGS